MTGTSRQVYRFGDFQMDTTERELRRADLLIPLAPTAFETLLALVERAGILVEKEALCVRVWPDRFVDDDMLSRNIVTLRKALGEMPDGRSYIETLPRRGCRFVGDVEELAAADDESTASVVGVPAAATPSHFDRAWRVVKVIVAGALALGVGYWMSALAAEIP